MRERPTSDPALHRLVAACGLDSAQPPRVVLVIGLPGSGKSRLLAALRASSVPPVLSATLEAFAPLQVVDATHTPISQVAQTLIRPEPLLLLIDDIHWGLDRHGIPAPELAEALTLALANPALTLVLTGVRLPLLPALHYALASGAGRLIDFARLAWTLPELQTRWQHLQPQPLDAAAARHLLERCAGWPLLLEWCCATGALDPAGAHALVTLALRRLPPPFDVWLNLALALPQFDPALLEELVGQRSLRPALSDWHHAGLLAPAGAALLLPLASMPPGPLSPSQTEAAWFWYTQLGADRAALQVALEQTLWSLARQTLARQPALADDPQLAPLLAPLPAALQYPEPDPPMHVSESRFHLRAHPAAAASSFRRPLLPASPPLDGPPALLQAQLALWSGQFGMAQRLALKTLRIARRQRSAPIWPQLQALLGDVALAQGRWRTALEHYRAVPPATPAWLRAQTLSALMLWVWAGPVDQQRLRVAPPPELNAVGWAGLWRQVDAALLQLPAPPAADAPSEPELAAAQWLWQAVTQLVAAPLVARAAWMRLETALEQADGRLLLLRAMAQSCDALLRVAAAAWRSPLAGAMLAEPPLRPCVQLHVLGPPELLVDGCLMRPPRRAYPLLTLLAMAGETGIDSAMLWEELWDGEPPRQAPRKLLERLRSLLPPEILRFDNYRYRLDQGTVDVAVDVLRLLETTLPAPPEYLRTQLALVRGPLLAGVDTPAIEALRTRATQMQTQLQLALADYEASVGNAEAELAACKQALHCAPLSEPAVLRLMQTLLRRGARTEALDVYERYRRQLRDDYGVDPTSRIDALARRALDGLD